MLARLVMLKNNIRQIQYTIPQKMSHGPLYEEIDYYYFFMLEFLRIQLNGRKYGVAGME